MDGDIPAPALDERLPAVDRAAAETAAPLELSAEAGLEAASGDVRHLARNAEVFHLASQLDMRAKVALMRRLMTQLKTEQIQALLDYGQREIADRQRREAAAAAENRQTSLLLKKDYTYQSRGLSEPTQYYVYLRRRKPKLDRYIGTLFYVPQGCTLSYFPDAEGHIFFNPPHNVFQLTDAKDPAVQQVVRLIGLEPPPPDYSFTKQQDDVPAIYLRLEHLHPQTYQPIAEEAYPFPTCMYEGGKLDRYRWEVSAVALPAEPEPPAPAASQSAIAPAVPAQPSPTRLDDVAAKPLRRVIELRQSAPVFHLADRQDTAAVLDRLRLWVSWSEQAMPQSRWDLVQAGDIYTLRNVSFSRQILRFSAAEGSIALENSLPVVVKWFQDLGLAVSQAQNQAHYSPAQLQLARRLFVDMSLPQEQPLAVLKKLFGVKFVKESAPPR